MRIHRLELTAFGPFPDTEVVDFDRLNASGLFLLTGPTGAGKTSILDAICFALYGAVPGSRNGAKAFKSDHAAGDAVPSVTLELTVRDRRVRVVRQPGWSRPSRRAKSGLVEEKAKATISELVEGTWVAHSNRVDEVGQLITSLLGMNKHQFCQVVMLPQGEFQTFLSSGAKERHDVLESLFRTHRFQAIERWLVDHRRALDVACRDAEAGLDRLVARVDEVLTGIERPSLLADVEGHADLADALRNRRADVTAATSDAAEARTTADAVAKSAQHALDGAHALLDRQRRHREAQNRMDELTSSAAEVRRREREIVLARNAAALAPLLDLVASAERQVSEATIAVTTAAAAWGADPEEPPADLAAAVDLVESLQRELVSLEALEPTQHELDELRTSMTRLAEALETERAREADLLSKVDAMPAALAQGREAVTAAQRAVTQLPALRQAREAAETAREAADRAVAIGRELEAARTHTPRRRARCALTPGTPCTSSVRVGSPAWPHSWRAVSSPTSPVRCAAVTSTRVPRPRVRLTSLPTTRPRPRPSYVEPRTRSVGSSSSVSGCGGGGAPRTTPPGRARSRPPRKRSTSPPRDAPRPPPRPRCWRSARPR